MNFADLNIGALQRILFPLVQALTKFDPSAAIKEKAEDFAAIEAAGNAIARFGGAGMAACADGVWDTDEALAVRDAAVQAVAAAKAVGVEVVDQTPAVA